MFIALKLESLRLAGFFFYVIDLQSIWLDN